MFQTLDVIISLAVVFLILSMALKFFMSMIKRGLKTKAKVVSEEMQTFIGEKTSTYLIPYLESKAKYLNFLELLQKKKETGKQQLGIRQLSKNQLQEMVTDLLDFLQDNQPDTVKDELKLTGTQIDLESEIDEIKTHLTRLKKKIENNYDNTLRRIAERYEGLMIKYSIIIGVIFAIVINADFFEMYKTLSKNSVATEKLVAQAEIINTRMEQFGSDLMKKEEQGFTSAEAFKKDVVEKMDRLSGEFETTGLNFGWNLNHFKRVKTFFSKQAETETRNDEKGTNNKKSEVNKGEDFFDFIRKVLGIFISGLLISFGAPFWHDFLEAITGMRRLLVGKAEKGEGSDTRGSFTKD